MGDDPIPGPNDMLVLWYRLPEMSDVDRSRAIERIDTWLTKIENLGWRR